MQIFYHIFAILRTFCANLPKFVCFHYFFVTIANNPKFFVFLCHLLCGNHQEIMCGGRAISLTKKSREAAQPHGSV